MDQYFSEHNTYLHATIANNKSTDILSSNLSPEGYYLLNIINQTNTTFKIQATPTGKQHDPQCASLIINQNGEQSTSVADANNKNNYKCWE